MEQKSLQGEARALSIEVRPFINGHFQDIKESSQLDKTSPADDLSIPAIPSCGDKEVNFAVDSASRAHSTRVWRDKTIEQKKEIFFKLATLMEANINELSLLDTLETGRAYLNFQRDSIPKAIQALRYFTESVDKHYGESIPHRLRVHATLQPNPLGVVGIITPWNDPLVVAVWKIAPALLMGNSVVLKPAEQSTYSILRVAELSLKAGIPPGVLNIIPGTGDHTGKLLALHPNVAGLFFTGSSLVGKKILCYSGQSNMKRVGLECGGKSPFIVSSRCKRVKQAAACYAKNMFYNQGQICSAPSRLIIDTRVKAEFMEELKNEMPNYIPGDPFNPETNVGCIISRSAQQRIQQFIETHQNEATEIYQPPTPKDYDINRCALIPTIISTTNKESTWLQEEIFGPIGTLFETRSLHESINMANSSCFGLAASIWTDDINEAHFGANELQAGIVHINSYGNDDNAAPFGGIKESGIGKDKSIHAFNEYSYLKTIWTELHEPI